MGERITTQQSVRMRDALSEKAMTYDDLVVLTGMRKPRVARWVKNNRESIRVAGWGPDKNGRLFIAKFAWGSEPDAKRPGRVLTAAEQMRKVRERALT